MAGAISRRWRGCPWICPEPGIFRSIRIGKYSRRRASSLWAGAVPRHPPGGRCAMSQDRPLESVADTQEDRVLILDFGSQVTQLIARRVRESGVYCEIHPFSMGEAAIRDFSPKAI